MSPPSTVTLPAVKRTGTGYVGTDGRYIDVKYLDIEANLPGLPP